MNYLKKLLESFFIILLVAILYHVVLFFGIIVSHKHSNDWVEKSFNNDYFLQRYSVRNIRLIKKSNNHFKRINNNFIVEYLFTTDRQYLIIKEIDSKIIEKMDNSSLDEYLSQRKWIGDNSICYSIIDLNSDEVYGPYKVEEFENFYKEKSIHFSDRWWESIYYEGERK